MSKLLCIASLLMMMCSLNVKAEDWNSSSIDGHYVLSALITPPETGGKKLFFKLYKAKYNNNGFERFLSQCNIQGLNGTVAMVINGKTIEMEKHCKRNEDNLNYWAYTPKSNNDLTFVVSQFRNTEFVDIEKTFVNVYKQKDDLFFHISTQRFSDIWMSR